MMDLGLIYKGSKKIDKIPSFDIRIALAALG